MLRSSSVGNVQLRAAAGSGPEPVPELKSLRQRSCERLRRLLMAPCPFPQGRLIWLNTGGSWAGFLRSTFGQESFLGRCKSSKIELKKPKNALKHCDFATLSLWGACHEISVSSSENHDLLASSQGSHVHTESLSPCESRSVVSGSLQPHGL